MGELIQTNRYLVTPSGRVVGSRVGPTLLLAGPLAGGPVVGVVGVAVGSAIDSPAVAGLACLVGVLLFLGGTIAAWAWAARILPTR